VVPADERNYRPKHVEMIEIINKIIIVASSWLFMLLQRRIYSQRIKISGNVA